jgi:hypothetical protein
MFLDKLDVDSDVCSWTVRVRTLSPIKANLVLFSDLTWYSDPQLSCTDKQALASQVHPISLEGSEDWSQGFTGNFPYSGSPQVWYLALSACELQQPHSFDVVLELYADQNSHFSVEDSFEPMFYSVLSIVHLFVLRLAVKRLLKQFMKTGDLVTPQFGLCTAVTLGFFGSMCKVCHLWLYYYDGEGLWLFNILATMLYTLSFLSLYVLFALLGRGWTTKSKDAPEAELVLPLFILSTLVFWFVVSCSFYVQRSVSMHTPYDGTIGTIRVLLEIGLAVLLNRLCAGLKQATTGALAKFADDLCLWSTVFAASCPVTGVVSWVLLVQGRLKFVTYALHLILLAAYAGLTYTFRDRSPYLRNSSLSSSVLPQRDARIT